MDSCPLKWAIGEVGGPVAAAAICGITVRSIYKWLARQALPRTEYSGETHYADLLAAASGGQFSGDWLRGHARPNTDNSDPSEEVHDAPDLSKRRLSGRKR